MTGLFQDLRYTLRQLRKNPVFAAVAVITVALGIGANTAIFSLLNAVILESVPISDPGHVVVLRWSARVHPEGHYSSFGDCPGEEGGSQPSGCSFSYPMFKEIRSQNVFSGVAAFAGPEEVSLTGNGSASIVRAEMVSGDYFSTLGVQPVAGRTLQSTDELPEAEPVAVLSYAYWKDAFNGQSSVIGKTIRLNGVPVTVIGIASPQFTRLSPGKVQDIWLPLTMSSELKTRGELQNGAYLWLSIVARTKQGTLPEQAQAAASQVFRNAVLYGNKRLLKEADNPSVSFIPVQRGLTGVRTKFAKPLYILMAVVGAVLLIACANVGGLLLVHATTREKEIAIRSALGAAPMRLVRQLLTEGVVLAMAGAGLGVLFAYWGGHALAAFLSVNSTLQVDTKLDARVLLFTAIVTVFAAIGFGLIPSFRGTRVNLIPALKESPGNVLGNKQTPGRRFRMGDSLVVTQVALSVIVLAGSGLLVHTLVNLKKVDPGFDTRNVLLFDINPPLMGYSETKTQSLYRDLQSRLANLPGVVSVSYSSNTLLNGALWSSGVHLEGQYDKSSVKTQALAVGPAFFETMRIPLLEGRSFAQSDFGSSQNVAIINQTFAKRFLGGRDPLGLHVRGMSRGKSTEPEYEIVGVVADTKYDQLRKDAGPTIYIPVTGGQVDFEVRTASNPSALITLVRGVVNNLDNDLPVRDISTQSQIVDRLLFNERLVAQLSALFGLLSLMLACIGIYGLLSYEVTRRTREIGIRSALGAQREDVFRPIIGRGIALAIAGLALGTAGGLVVTRYLQSLLFGVKSADPWTFAGVALVMVVVAWLASYIPARRAAKVDPIVALRYE